jgi:cereblon
LGGDGGGAEAHEGFTFDTNLASMHTYLGEVDDVGSSHSSAQGGSMVTLPMFYLEGIVLFPEEKLPLRVLQPRFKAAVVRAMQQEDNEAPNTLGVIHVRAKPQDRGIIVASVGTTAEVVAQSPSTCIATFTLCFLQRRTGLFMHSLIWQCGLSLNLLVCVCAEQIRQLGYHSDGSVNIVTKGRQRFQIWRAWTEPDGAVVPLPSIRCSQIVML